MKRSPFLLTLSRDHHTALSLANRIARTADALALTALAESAMEEFHQRIAPHFRAEEEGLLIRLEQTGETALVQRTLAEHRQLLELASRIGGGDILALKVFGLTLHDHVRFEERELFEVAERLLGDS